MALSCFAAKHLGISLAAISLLVTPATGQDRIPLFEDLWEGRATAAYPSGIPDPAKLRRMFEREPEMLPWAADSEKLINASLEGVSFGRAAKAAAECRATICQIVVTMPLESLGTRDEADIRINTAAFAIVDSLTAKMKKEYSLTIAENKSTGNIGILIYLFDPG